MIRGLVYLRSLTILAFLSLATASASAQLFEENFDHRDGPGPTENWTVFSEHWWVVNRTLHAHTNPNNPGIPPGIPSDEAWSWAGNPPIEFPTTCELSFDIEFLRPGAGVGRHGGVMFCADSPTMREGTNNTGYDLHWIDRERDRGLRLLRYDSAPARETSVLIGRGASTLRDPPSQWRIIIDTETIEVWGDGQLLMEVQDETYRGGLLGFWAHGSNQDVMFDNIRVDTTCTDCEKRAVEPGEERTGVLGSSGCTGPLDDQPIELFSLTVEDIFEGTLSVTSGEFAPSLSFYNDFCDLIALNSNCPDPDTQACFGINLGPGTYTIGVSGQPGDPGGTFTLNISDERQGTHPRFVRGDSNSDGSINLSDGVTPLLYLFRGGDEPACMVAADANDTGGIEIADAILVFNWLFQGGPTPAPPAPSSAGYLATDCGEDLGEAALGCERTALTCQ